SSFIGMERKSDRRRKNTLQDSGQYDDVFPGNRLIVGMLSVGPGAIKENRMPCLESLRHFFSFRSGLYRMQRRRRASRPVAGGNKTHQHEHDGGLEAAMLPMPDAGSRHGVFR